MPALRFMAALFALVAVLALAADLTPVLMRGEPFAPKSVVTQWSELAPKTLESTRQSISSSLSPGIWNTLSGTLLAIPAVLFFTIAAAVTGYAGRRRHRINIYAN